jgi:arsenate reductase
LKTTGFVILSDESSTNPTYAVRYSDHESTSCFSKVYDHPDNPQEKFAAIMTCSDADENCPFIPSVGLRIGTTYEDPKAADGTAEEAATYLERSNQIATETLYAFSLVH